MNAPEIWRLRKQRLQLIGSNCGACLIVHFPPREICPDCGCGGSAFDPEKAMELRKKVLAARAELGK